MASSPRALAAVAPARPARPSQPSRPSRPSRSSPWRLRSSDPSSTPRTGLVWRAALVGGCIGALAALIYFAPARWLAAALAQVSDGRVLLENSSGSVWSGAADVVFASGTGGSASIALPGRLSWQLRPTRRGIRARLELPCCAEQPLVVNAEPGSDALTLRVADGRSRWPAALLAGFGAPWNTLKLDGMLELATQDLVLDWRRPLLGISGAATLDASDISSSLSTLRPMGSYRLSLAGGPAPTMLLVTRGGALQLNGSGSWNGKAFRFSGEANAAAGREAALANLLNIIGRRDATRSIITLGSA
ncbi:MAG: type II secretion system protein N [Variovorax sp.]